MVTDNIKRMSPAELREACICAAATAVVAYVLGYGYEDIAVYDDGEGWPTTMSDVDTARWPIGDDPGPMGRGEPSCDTAYRDIATIYEAGGLASLKLRGLGSHRVSLIETPWGAPCSTIRRSGPRSKPWPRSSKATRGRRLLWRARRQHGREVRDVGGEAAAASRC